MSIWRATVARLGAKGVQIKGSILKGESGTFAHLEDPDGNELYLWEVNRQVVPEAELAYIGTGVSPISDKLHC